MSDNVTRIRPTRRPLPAQTQDALGEIASTVSTARAILEYVSEALVTRPELVRAGAAGSQAMLAVDAAIRMLAPVSSAIDRIAEGLPVQEA